MTIRMIRSLAFLAIALIASITSTARGNLPQGSGAGSVRDRFESLSAEYQAKRAANFRASERAETGTDLDRQKVVETVTSDNADYAKRFLALAREDPQGTVSADALATTIQIGGHGPEARAAVELIHHDFAANPKMRLLIQQVALSPCLEVEDLLRAVMAKNPDRTARGLACQGLGNLLDAYANLPRLRAQDPGMARILERTVGKESLDHLARRDAEAMLREAEVVHERVLGEFADVRNFPGFATDPTTLGKASETWLSARRKMAIGASAPPIEGKDVDGKSFKLSDYRGKVVVVVFWASWCGPCMAQVPHERALASRLRGRPFALLGVNCDLSKEEARVAMAKADISWPNWFDGDPNEGPITARWNARALPKVFVLDTLGVIRFKDVRGEALGKAVDDLLEEKPPAR